MNRRVVLHAIDATPAISTQWRDACYFHTVARCVRGRGHASGVADEIAEHARGEQRRSVDDAEGHEQDAKQAGGHVLHNDLVLTKGTKQDLVEGGRRGDGSVHVDPCPEVSVQRVYEKRRGFRWSKFTTFARFEATQSAYGANPLENRASGQ